MLIRSGLSTLMAGVLLAMTSVIPAHANQLAENSLIKEGFYTAAGRGLGGFSIVDDEQARFHSEIERLGGVETLGYPVSRRFTLDDGLLYQATQKALLQWDSKNNKINFANVFDLLSTMEKDAWLEATRQIPPSHNWDSDKGKSWEEIKANHLAILDQNAALKGRFLSNPNWLEHYGLPMAIKDMGNAVVLRAQRAAFQYWKEDVPWAKKGQVTIVNAGDIAKESGLVPAFAQVPEVDPEAVLERFALTLTDMPADFKLQSWSINRGGDNSQPQLLRQFTTTQSSSWWGVSHVTSITSWSHTKATRILPAVRSTSATQGWSEVSLGNTKIGDQSLGLHTRTQEGLDFYLVYFAYGQAFGGAMVGGKGTSITQAVEYAKLMAQRAGVVSTAVNRWKYGLEKLLGEQGAVNLIAFTLEVDAAVRRRDVEFFMSRVLPQDVDCTFEGAYIWCSPDLVGKKGKAIGTSAFPASGRYDVSLSKVQQIIRDYFTDVDPTASDEYGTGEVRVIGLANPRSQVLGVVIARISTTGERDGLMFNFRQVNSEWRLVSLAGVRKSELTYALGIESDEYMRSIKYEAIPWLVR
jgi:hypothetical protein